jgi:hypothetical protein
MSNIDPQKPNIIIQPSSGVIGVATETIGALKGSPILVVMVALNIAFIGAGTYYLGRQQDNLGRLMDKVFDRCLPAVDGYRSDGNNNPLYRPPHRPATGVIGDIPIQEGVLDKPSPPP